MNFEFEREFYSTLHLYPTLILELNKKNKCVFSYPLDVLKNRTVAVDADYLLTKVKASSTKSIQEGHAALDMMLQQDLVDLILRFK